MTFLIAFDHFEYKLDLFGTNSNFLINFEPLESILTQQFGLGQKIRIKNLIKSWFHHDIKQNLALDQLDHRSLIYIFEFEFAFRSTKKLENEEHFVLGDFFSGSDGFIP